ncbi:Trehalose-phosphatase [Phytophthora infestans]|uniref:Trehalose-phosphatase n=1 Tax=Phytophthora infestans TaxID=4787 RepID=A0A833TJU2_PHYIN|nr:Trehalose-phosphatase [Phytophthora infestans]
MYVKKDFTAVTGKRPSRRMMEALTNLTNDPRNTVFVSIDIDNTEDTNMQDDSNPTDRHWHQHSFKFDWRPVRGGGPDPEGLLRTYGDPRSSSEYHPEGLLEIVPEGLNKGVVARQILTQDAAISNDHPDFLFCIGDDTTREYVQGYLRLLCRADGGECPWTTWQRHL